MRLNLAGGIAAAADGAASYFEKNIDSDRKVQEMGALERMKQQIEQEKQARIAAIVGGVSRTKDTAIAGPTQDGSSLGVMQEQKTEHEYSRDVGDALAQRGLITDAGKFYDRADRHEDKTELRTTQAAKQKSDDEKWHATNNELIRHHKSLEAKAAASLGLKDKEAKDFAKAVDSYIEGKADYDMLIGEGKGNDPDIIAAAKQQMDRAALQLKQFHVDVGTESSEFAKHLNLSATLEKLNKTISDPMTDAPTIEKAKMARDQVLTQMTAVTGLKHGGGGEPQDVRVGGKVIGQASTQAEADALVAAYKKSGGKPAAAAAPAKPVQLDAVLLDKQIGGDGGMIQTRKTL